MTAVPLINYRDTSTLNKDNVTPWNPIGATQTNAAVIITLVPPNAKCAIRTGEIQGFYTGFGASANAFTISDGVNTMYGLASVGATIPMEQVYEWAAGATVTITLPAGGTGITGFLSVAYKVVSPQSSLVG